MFSIKFVSSLTGIYPNNLMSGSRLKKLNRLTEFSNSIFIKFYFKAYLRWTCIQIKLSWKFFSILSYLFVLQMQKEQNLSGVLPHESPPWLHHKSTAELTVPQAIPTFYNIWKLNLCSKMNISKTAWINACIEYY